MRQLSKKQKAAVVGVAAVVAAAGFGTAFAYWTSSGTGSGSATTAGGTADGFTIDSITAPSNMGPGVAAGNITAGLTNHASSPAYVGTVRFSIAVTPAADAVGGCTADDYTLSNPDVVLNKEIAAFDFQALSGPTLGFNNKADVNQDGCKGASVVVSAAVVPSA